MKSDFKVNSRFKKILLFLILVIPMGLVSFILSLIILIGLDFEIADHAPYSGSGPLEMVVTPLLWILPLFFMLILTYIYHKKILVETD